jgi:hypothetical protein
MNPVSPDAFGEKKFAEFHFRPGVFCPDAGHVEFPLGLSEDIGHQIFI